MSIFLHLRHRRNSDGWHIGRRLLLGSVAFLALWALQHEIAGPDGYLAYRHQMQIYARAQARLRRLELRNRALHVNVQQLRSDPSAIQSLARRQLYLTRPGEVIYTYPAPPKSAAHAGEASK